MVRIPTERAPTHPGEMLLEEFLNPMKITQRELANAINVPYQRVNELVNQKRGVTPSTALRLARFFNVSADFWLNLQVRFDLYQAQQLEKHELGVLRDSIINGEQSGPMQTIDRKSFKEEMRRELQCSQSLGINVKS